VGRIEKSVIVALATLLLAGPGIWGVITCAVHGGRKVSISLAEYMERDVSALHLELTGCTLVYEEAMGTYTETGMRQDYREFYVPVAPGPGFDGSYKVIVHIRDEQSLKRMEPMTRRHAWAGLTDPDDIPVASNVTLEGTIRWGVETLGGDHDLIEREGGVSLTDDWVILEQFAEPKAGIYVILLVAAGVVGLGGACWVIGSKPRRR
jgi:hypothetical protein